MKKKIIIFIIIALSYSIVFGGNFMNSQFYGVWANENAELVITEKIILLFFIDGKEQISILKTYELNENQIVVYTKSVAYFNKSNEKANCKYFNRIDNSWKDWGDKNDFPEPIFQKSFFLKETEKSVEIANDEKTFLKLNKNTQVLTIHSNFTQNQNLEKIEKIGIVDFRLPTKATKETVGKCLVEWSIGATYEEDDKNNTFSTQINTNKHSYTFSFNKWNEMQILYCRAARIRTNNNGSVFAQNIRMMKNDNEFSANFPLNNMDTSKQEIKIDNDLFNPNSCVFIDGGNEIYWSLKSVSDDLIILNGCGEEYKYSRTIKENENKEYFKYESYQ